ncbi:MAG: mechanosensitive ion channel family protein [Treponema sp.]|nr:mechanosensitive ion channel family protein [Treponema sp.]
MRDFLMGIWDFEKFDLLGLGRRIIVAALIAFAGRIITAGTGKIITKAGGSKFGFDETLASVLRKGITYGVFIICVIMILDVFGVNTNSLIAILGAAGVAVGLALKDTLSNIAAGIILLLQASCRKGDFIEFGSVMGTVKEMNLFTTILETADGVFISAPNSSIWGTPLKNYTRNGKRRMDLSVGISYSDSVDAAFEVMRGIIGEEKRFLPEPKPQIMVQSLGDGVVTITLRAWAEGDQYWALYWDEMRNIKEKIEAAGLRIPFPRRDVHLYRDTAEERRSGGGEGGGTGG